MVFSSLAILQISPEVSLLDPLIVPEEQETLIVSQGESPEASTPHSSIRSQSMTNQFTELEAINDQELLTATGGGAGAALGWTFANILGLGIPIVVDAFANDGGITKSAINA